MSALLEKIKKVNQEKYVEIEFEGVKFWVSSTEMNPYKAQKKRDELKIDEKGISESEKASRNEEYSEWVVFNSLFDKKDDGTYEKLTPEEWKEVKPLLSFAFLKLVNDTLIRLMDIKKDAIEKNA